MAKGEIGSVRAVLSVTTSAFEKGFARATASVKTFKSALSGVGSSIAAVGTKMIRFGAIAGGLAVAGLTALVKQSFTAVDALAKASDRIGITTEALQVFHLAAKLGGESVEGMDKSLVKFLKSMSEAKAGLSTQVRAFDDLGLSADTLQRLPLTEALGIMGDAMNSLGNASRRARVAMDIFGRGGVKMINVLKDGSAGLRSTKEEAERLGLTLSRFDAAGVEAANDAITKMRDSVRAVFNNVAAALSPAITDLANRFTNLGFVGTTAVKSIELGMQRVVVTVAGLIDGLAIAGRLLANNAKISALQVSRGVLGAAGAGATGARMLFNTALLGLAGTGLPGQVMAQMIGGGAGGRFAQTLPTAISDEQKKLADVLDKLTSQMDDIIRNDRGFNFADRMFDWLQGLDNNSGIRSGRRQRVRRFRPAADLSGIGGPGGIRFAPLVEQGSNAALQIQTGARETTKGIRNLTDVVREINDKFDQERIIDAIRSLFAQLSVVRF